MTESDINVAISRACEIQKDQLHQMEVGETFVGGFDNRRLGLNPLAYEIIDGIENSIPVGLDPELLMQPYKVVLTEQPIER